METTQDKPRRHKRVYLHPLPVRIWHWVNAAGFMVLILTGVGIRYNDMFPFVHFETTVNIHNFTGFVVIFNYVLWLGYYLFSDKGSNYHPVLDAKEFFRNYFRQMDYYGRGIFMGEPKPHKVRPHDKFNAMQRLTYQIVMMVSGPIQIISGVMLWDVNRFADWIEFFGGIRVVSTVHVAMFILFVFFIMVHAYMGFLGPKPSTHYKEMFTGYEEDH